MNKIKNIIIVNDFAYIEGGASRVALETAIALSDIYNVVLFTAVGPISNELKNSNVEIICLNQSDILHNKNRAGAIVQGLYNKKAKIGFSNLLDKYSPSNTIIHVHTWTKGISSSIFKVAEKKSFHVVLTLHDFFTVCPNGGLFDYKAQRICDRSPLSFECIKKDCDSRSYGHKLFRLIRQLIQNRNIRSCKNISYIYISEFAFTELKKRFNGYTPCYYLKNPVNFNNRFKVECESNKYYLYAGRLTEDKGIRVFCEAVTKANVSSIVLGNGILYNELSLEYPNIQFLGWMDKQNMNDILEKTRCFIFPSIYYEVSPLTPLEMMACGIPCLVSDKNSSKTLIKNGYNGYTYDGYSNLALADCINKCKNDSQIKIMSENIYKTFSDSEYSMETHIKSLVDIYKMVIK